MRVHPEGMEDSYPPAPPAEGPPEVVVTVLSTEPVARPTTFVAENRAAVMGVPVRNGTTEENIP